MRVTRIALRLLRPRRQARVPDRFGNWIWCPSLEEPIASALFSSGVYEPETLSAILSYLPADGTFMDVGANVGAISLPVAVKRPHSRVISVEGDPRIAAILRRNVEENARLNVAIVECLAGSEEKSALFYRAPADKFGMGSIGPQFDVAPVDLQQRKLDSVLDESGIGDIDVVKLDIEGAELGALRGLERRLTSSRRPVIIFEFSDWAEARVAGQNPGDAQAYLMSIGYRLFRLECAGMPRLALTAPVRCGANMILAVPNNNISQ